jgi:hypothetical protein
MDNGNASHFPLMKLAAKYNQMQTNGQILSNRSALEVVRMRIRQLAERIDLNDAPERMIKIIKLWKEFRYNQHADGLKAEVTAMTIDAEIEAAYHDYMSWQQMFTALDLDRKLVESEMKVIKEIKAIMTVEDGYELSAKLLAAVIQVLKDDPDRSKKLKRIQYEFAKIIGEQPGTKYTDDAEGDDWGSVGAVIDGRSGDVDRAEFLDPGDQGRPEAEGAYTTGDVPEGLDTGNLDEGQEWAI